MPVCVDSYAWSVQARFGETVEELAQCSDTRA
jgi:hypothetical protein